MEEDPCVVAGDVLFESVRGGVPKSSKGSSSGILLVLEATLEVLVMASSGYTQSRQPLRQPAQ